MQMKRLLALPIILLLAISANADTIGESPVEGGGSVDGWSGITYLSGYGSIPAGHSVTSWEYYADEGRADGTRSVQPLIIREDAGDASLSVWGVGPVSKPEAGGVDSETWGSDTIPDDGSNYYAGVWQWADGVDDTDGGTIPFNGAGGSGMSQVNLDGTTYVPAAGDALDAPGHSAGVDGRAYQFNFTTAVPEPGTAALAGIAMLLGGMMLRRRK